MISIYEARQRLPEREFEELRILMSTQYLTIEQRDRLRDLERTIKRGPIVTCHSFKFNHCNSCHEDQDQFGYELSEFEFRGRDFQGCCAFEDFIKEKAIMKKFEVTKTLTFIVEADDEDDAEFQTLHDDEPSDEKISVRELTDIYEHDKKADDAERFAGLRRLLC